ncbi:MAG: hypothetical protein ACR2FX_13225 [Chthoniobacterales bacterium]
MATVKSARDPWQRAPTDLQGLVTERFLTALQNMRPEIENSGLLDANSSDARLTVEDVKLDGSTATARALFAGRMVGRHRLNIYLVEDHGVWKIDDVKLIEDD